MTKKTRIKFLRMETLAVAVGLQYTSLRNSIARKLKNNEPLEFEAKDGTNYKLFGEPKKIWFAYDADKYDITIE